MHDACLNSEVLRDYLAGHTSSPLTSEIEGHLLKCSACQNRLAEQPDSPGDNLVSILRQATALPPDHDEPQLFQALSAMVAQAPSRVAAADLSGGTIIRNYRLVEKIGEGGMGTVYLAIHTRLEKPVAVKLLKADRKRDPQAISRFEREMRAVGKLEHPNIIRAHDAGEENGVHYLAMEYVAGVDLSWLVRVLGPLPIAAASEVVRQAALGLHHAHTHGLVHRDVKPSNLMLAADGCVKVLDLGLAQLLPGDEPHLTTDHQILGTLRYIAPEQLRAGAEVDAASDIYSLGVTFYELLLGTEDFRRLSLPIESAALTALRPHVSPALVELLQQMTARRREKRSASMLAIAQALEPHCRGAQLAELLSRSGQVASQAMPWTSQPSYSSAPMWASAAQVVTQPIALQPTDVVPPPLPPPLPPPVVATNSLPTITAIPAADGRWWNRVRPYLATVSLSACLTILAALLIVYANLPTEAERVRQLFESALVALQQGDLDAADAALVRIKSFNTGSPLASQLQKAIDHRKAEDEQQRLEEEEKSLWTSVSQALDRTDPTQAKVLLLQYLAVSDRPHAAEAQGLVEQCDWALSPLRSAQTVAQWNDYQLSACKSDGTLPENTALPAHHALAGLVREQLIKAATTERKRRIDEAELQAKVAKEREKLEDETKRRLAWVRQFVNQAEQRGPLQQNRAALIARRERRAKEDAAWRTALDPKGVLSLIPQDAAAVIVIPTPDKSWEKLARFLIALGQTDAVRLAPLFAGPYRESLFPFKVDWSQPVLIVLPVAAIPERIHMGYGDYVRSVVIVAACAEPLRVARDLEVKDRATLNDARTVVCKATKIKEMYTGFFGEIDSDCFARMRGKHVCYGLNREAVDRVATTPSIIAKMPAEVGERVMSGDLVFLANATPWKEPWNFDRIDDAVASPDDLENDAAKFLELAKCVDFGTITVNWDEGLALSAFTVFSKQQDAATERLVPAIVSSGKPATLAGLPPDRAAWAFGASGDGPSNVVIAHGLLQTPVNHYLVPRTSSVNSGDFAIALTKALQHVQGSRAALYHTGDGVAAGVFSSVVVIDSENPQQLRLEIEKLIEQSNRANQGLPNDEQRPPVTMRLTQLDGRAMYEIKSDPVFGLGEGERNEVRRLLGNNYPIVRLVVEKKALVFHIGDDLDVLRQCCRNLAEGRPGLAEHASIDAQHKQPGVDPRVEFHIASQFFLDVLSGKAAGAVQTPSLYSSSVLSLDLTRLRVDLFAPTKEIKPLVERALQNFAPQQ